MTKFIFSSLTILLLMSGCKKNSDSTTSNSLQTNIQSSIWKITNYNNNGADQTSDFNGYSFTFKSGNLISATYSNGSANGSWSIGTDDSKQKLIISFPNSSPLDELNEDWEVLAQNSSIIQLKHVSGGNGGIQLLTFEKI